MESLYTSRVIGRASGMINAITPYIYPNDLFTCSSSDTVFWTCVRTRPQWEKKLAQTLSSRRMAFYLPVISKLSCSGRKTRVHSLPLFPGILFVKGNCTKQLLRDSGRVICIIKPRTPLEEKVLDEQIRAVWRTSVDGMQAKLETDFTVGEKVKILSGPLEGLSGEVVRIGNSKRLKIWIDIAGVGVSVVLGSETNLSKLN